ncbi:MAG: lipase family alpha/beta hydrolase [Phycisphaerales bacterium]
MLAITVVVGSAGRALAACPPTETAPAPDAQAQALKSRARQAVEKASGWTQGALDWMNRKTGADSIMSRADSWRASAETRLIDAIEDALAAPAPPTGVRLLTAIDADTTAEHGVGSELAWIPLDNASAAPPSHVVLLIHGLDEPGNVWDDLAPMLRAQRHHVVRFDYPDDQPLRASGDELIAALARLRARGVTSVDLVCHSMGGLIARDVLTRPDAYASDARGNASTAGALPAVERWIMMAVPHHGAPLARVRFIAEAREHLVRWFESDGMDPRQLLGFLKDGAGEAGADLLPGSDYLTDLAARPLPANVRITNVIGALADGQRQRLEGVLHSDWIAKVLPPREVERLTAALDSASECLGDGIVSVDSARLPGVEDEVVIPSLHRMLAKRPLGESELLETIGESPKAPDAARVILDRLRR